MSSKTEKETLAAIKAEMKKLKSECEDTIFDQASWFFDEVLEFLPKAFHTLEKIDEIIREVEND